jgi:hypothetical protein
VSIPSRDKVKSIGFVNNPVALFSIALRFLAGRLSG